MFFFDRDRINFFNVANEITGNTKQQQYWDSNNGRNYVLTSQEVPVPTPSLPVSLSFGKHDSGDAYTYEFDDWAKFAAWRNLPTKGPYW